jgi:dipeptidase D
MKTRIIAASFILAFSAAAAAAPAPAPSPAAVKAASHAVSTYRNELVAMVGKMISFNTVADPAYTADKNPVHIAFKQYLKGEAERLGLDFKDHGYVAVIGLGSGSERVGIITHGDVQPVDPSKWKKSPFELDTTSEPGRLIGRGTEDDKGPIATAMLAMKAIKDQKLPLSKRLELYIYMAEESDWDPIEAFLKTHVPPQMNITLDAEYPAVVAEKGWGQVSVVFAKPGMAAPDGVPAISAFGGGSFGSQIPEDANATILNAGPGLEARIKARADGQRGMRYQYNWKGKDLVISARGLSAHSSKPEDGVNAVSMLADALNVQVWPATPAGGVVNFLNDMIGTGIYGEKFGKIAYSDKFMGPLTFVPTVIRQKDEGIEININLRRPQGKTDAALSAEINAALAQWQARRMPLVNVKVQVTAPWIQHNAPQVPTLLSVFSYYTGSKNPKPISIGGGTNSRMFPSAVSFGPAMPGAVYSGHSEHEFITLKQLLLNLQMYTAVMVELAK